jgi:membrane protein insertase Oxa1/YidC/SpoIIIJ
LIALSMPAGLVIYFFVSNVWRLGQQELIMRKIAIPDSRQKPGAETGGAPSNGSGNGKAAPEPGRLGRLLKPPEPTPAPPPKPAASKPVAPTPARRQKKRRK